MNEIIGASLIFFGLLLASAGLVWLVGRGLAVLTLGELTGNVWQREVVP